MPLPKPPVALTDVCTVIYDNTLYAYSAGAFQSLRLEPGAQWKQLSQGVSVTGAACIGSTPVAPREPGFWVIGGKGPADYQGLQKFTYSTGRWESVKPVTPVTQDRQWHGAAYINDTDAILIYAGAQDGAKHLSTQTFTIGASAPYEVRSYDSAAPPTVNPMLLPWSSTQVALVGGSDANREVMLFSTALGWENSKATLASALPNDISTTRAVLVAGDDGSKSLYTFDMSQSPNRVTRTVLIDGQGQPVKNSQPISARSPHQHGSDAAVESLHLNKRLTSDQWPRYNSTLAPTATRSNFGVASSADGQVVFAGGNADDVLCIFDARGNRWQNASAVFAEQVVFSQADPTISPTPTSTTTTSSTSVATTPASTSSSPTPKNTTTAGSVSAAEPTSGSSSSPPTTILAAVLGTTGAILIILGILYCLLRRKKKRQDFVETGHTRRAGGMASNEKGGVPLPADNYPQAPPAFRGHQPHGSQASFSSMAILMGKVNNQAKQAAVERKPSKDSKRSSTSSILNQAFKKSISNPMPHNPNANPFSDPPSMPLGPMEQSGALRSEGPDGRLHPDGTRRSSGWNRYWSTGGNTLNILGLGNGGASRRTTMASDTSSHYSNSQANRVTQDSATVPHLTVNANRVPQEPKPGFSRVNSGSPTISQYSPHIKQEMKGRIERPMSAGSASSGYSSGIPASVHDAWDPTSTSKPWGTDRAPSSAYLSVYSTSQAPSAPPPNPVPSGVSRQPQLAMAATSSDMSWLNLGEQNKDKFRI